MWIKHYNTFLYDTTQFLARASVSSGSRDGLTALPTNSVRRNRNPLPKIPAAGVDLVGSGRRRRFHSLLRFKFFHSTVFEIWEDVVLGNRLIIDNHLKEAVYVT